MKAEVQLTSQQAFEVARASVRQHYDRGPEGAVLLILSSMGHGSWDDPLTTNDPATWDDWAKCVVEVVEEGEQQC